MATAKEIGIGIKNARLTVGITQAELAHRLGVTPQAISQYERGIKKPKIETIEKIADALGVSWLHLSHLEDLATASRARELYQKDKVKRRSASCNSETISSSLWKMRLHLHLSAVQWIPCLWDVLCVRHT